MGKIIVSEFISLDGVVESPQNWHFPYISNDMAAFIEKSCLDMDAMVLGRITYEEFASYWPHQNNDTDALTKKFNTMPKYVVSRTLEAGNWHPTTVIKNPIEDLQAIKEKYTGTIGITGSPNLVQSLLANGVIDEYQLMVHPIVVGDGKRLFTGGLATTPLKLVDTQTFESGVMVLTYRHDQQV